MAITYNINKKIFNLKTKTTSYVMGILNQKYLMHLYHGRKIDNFEGEISELIPTRNNGNFSPKDIDGIYSSDVLPLEYPCYGSADLRTPAFHAEYENGSAVTKLEYASHKIFKGKKVLQGLPATYTDDESEAETLEVTLTDQFTGMEVVLSYTVFEEFDAIAKSVRITNKGTGSIQLKSVISSSAYLFDKNYNFVHLSGAWARERHIEKQPLTHGVIAIDSKRGASSHHHNPFVALARPETTEEQGEVYGYSLVYSGNFVISAEVDHFDTVRINAGINTFGFNWKLLNGETFQAPEIVCIFSENGFGDMSRKYHKLYRTRLCRGMYRDCERPVLINNWEATYFKFDEDKIVDIAKKAKDVGVEMMVLDDGWFGHRDDDKSSLGDWIPDIKKLPNGINGIAQKIVDMGMRFGLWFEPEMISRDSELFKHHSDWCIHAEGRICSEGRNQLVLDLTREDVRDYIVKAVSDILNSAPISYVKWDMNRNISEPGSDKLPANRQQEFMHRYMLGLYEVLERITSAFPNVLFEGCAGGGGRFDAGMLYYFPQYWTSDDTDAIERLYIQYGTSIIMPSSVMGSHVSAVPNHQVGRTTPLITRGHVAMMGQFGYELDLAKLTEDELETVKEQIDVYKSIRHVIHSGNMYRLKSPFENNSAAWSFVTDNKQEAVLMHCSILVKPELPLERIRLQGLQKNAVYSDIYSGKEYSGEFLMNYGIKFDNNRDFKSEIMYFKQK